MSLRSPLGRVLGLGTAKDGTSHWWGQRVSAVALLLLGLWFAFSLATMESFSHSAAVAFVEDYVHAPGLKLVSLILSRFAHIFFAVAAIFAILKIGLGA